MPQNPLCSPPHAPTFRGTPFVRLSNHSSAPTPLSQQGRCSCPTCQAGAFRDRDEEGGNVPVEDRHAERNLQCQVLISARGASRQGPSSPTTHLRECWGHPGTCHQDRMSQQKGPILLENLFSGPGGTSDPCPGGPAAPGTLPLLDFTWLIP